jgi:MOSC domain-containing protein YiiM
MAYIFQINTSSGGLPKSGHPTAQVNISGLVDDQHRDMEHHGGPDRAVCLYSLELIQALQTEGHPVFPGAMGENITVVGSNWEHIKPGAKIKLGGQVILEVTAFTVPCNNLIPFFLKGDFSRVSQLKHPGWSRVYTRVLQAGPIQIGDTAEVIE